ncbi:MAG: zinc ABC transporter substrate-binding protein [Candidatus Neomarinimicrobiota bacterium]|jgi:zinc transport system substrate-binding protein|nr:zinc ABC transporter substrate-binding protein [Candidatus Neomarinimicrobiota bacterium]MDD3965535.1 zinc ABC transporter substrate-binding protein [Candidatus Neomarinimicrobiota bacterium]MDX9780392.1 zinc ABC transporter substrate-binding protein [bacterium]
MRTSYKYFITLLIFLLTSCDMQPGADICVSLPPQAYLVRRIAGEAIPVSIMIPPGSAPPTYSPTPSQIRDLQQCRLYIKNGHPDFHFEKKHIDPYLMEHPEIHIVDMADSMDIIPGDAHIWLSPSIMRTAAGRIYRELNAIWPERNDYFYANYQNLIRDIDSLDRELQSIFRDHRGVEFLTMHPSWTYFARDYGIRQISIREENKAPSARQLSALIDHAKNSGIRIIFIQKEFAFEQTDVLAREINAQVVALDPLNESWLNNLRLTGRIFLRTFNDP